MPQEGSEPLLPVGESSRSIECSRSVKNTLRKKFNLDDGKTFLNPVPVVRYYLAMSSVNISLLIGCVAYMSGNVILLWLLSVNEKCDMIQAANGTMILDPDPGYVPGSMKHHCPVETFVFHRIEFTGTFLFNVLNQFIVVYSPEGTDPRLKKVLKWIALINIVCSFIGMMLVWIDLGKFEIPSHEVEYGNSIMMALFDVMLLSGRHSEGWEALEGKVLSFLAVTTSLIQPVIYNEWLPASFASAWGIAMGEEPAHRIEFSFEILSAFVSARVIYENKLACDLILHETIQKDRSDAGETP